MEIQTPEQDKKSQDIKKIKLIVSDLHLGKGRILTSGGINSLEEFYYGDKFVEFINYYSIGVYKDYEIELIINGDFLNFLQVDYKGHNLTVITESVAMEVLKSIIQGHPQVFKALKDFANNSSNRQITYVVGNHDQAMLFPETRVYFNQVLQTQVKFKNIVYYIDGVHIEHGHMHESANRLDPKKFFLKKDLAEPILNLPFGSHFFVNFVLKIKAKYPHIDKIRPFSKMLRWTFFNETSLIIKSFFQLIAYLVRCLVTKNARNNYSLKTLLKIVFESAIFPDLGGAAKKILNDERVHTVIFGHSHVYQYRQYDVNKEYFNTGTWTEITSLDINSLGKFTKLTYVLLEYPENSDRPRGRLKEWKGFHRIEEDVAIS